MFFLGEVIFLEELNIIGLLDDADTGSFLFNNEEVISYNERKRADLRKRNIGFVFQSFNLIDELTVYENVELPLLYLGIDADERKKRVEAVLEKVQIMHRRNHFPQQLSGGQQQRCAVARAVVNNPKLILADEPTGNLDSKNGNLSRQSFINCCKLLVDSFLSICS